MKDLKAFVEEVKARPGGPIKPVPEFKPAETYAYASGDRAVPSSCRRPRPSRPRPSPARPPSGPEPRREELEQFPLDTLRMVGILEQNNEIWGLSNPRRRRSTASAQQLPWARTRQDQPAITEDQIELTELIPDGIGGYIERRATLALADRGERKTMRDCDCGRIAA